MSGDSERERRGMRRGGACAERVRCQVLLLGAVPTRDKGPLNQSELAGSDIHHAYNQKPTCHREPYIYVTHKEKSKTQKVIIYSLLISRSIYLFLLLVFWGVFSSCTCLLVIFFIHIPD